jgi:hypothetical protein
MAYTITHGLRQGSTDAAQMPTYTYQAGFIKALADNTGNVYIGGSSDVTIAGTTDNLTTGYELDAGNVFLLGKAGNLQDLWYITDNAGDDFIFWIENF